MLRDRRSRGYATARFDRPYSPSGNPYTDLLTPCRGHRINRKRSHLIGARHGARADPDGVYGRPGAA
jgi:hypothetical protein